MNLLNQSIIRATKKLGFENFTEIQEKTMPLIKEGRDVIGHSQTGTGKTAAFALPILELINPKDPNVQALILCPTRELAVQVKTAIDQFSLYLENVKTVAIYGGEPITHQIKALKKRPQIIVGTPGRTIDHINRKLLKLEHIKFLVLDEADEMLNMGFKEDIEIILQTANNDRQTIMFSATMPRPILALSKTYMKDPVHVTVVPDEKSNKNITQYYYLMKEGHKIEALSRLYAVYQPNLSLVFCNTKRKVDDLTDKLISLGLRADKIHGDLPQARRMQILDKFHRGALDFLVATDVAARGLDIKNVEAVFNFDVPDKYDYYVHRIGRTGRVDRKGFAFTFFTKKEMQSLAGLERFIKSTIQKEQIPSAVVIKEAQSLKLENKLVETIDAKKHYPHIQTAQSLADALDPVVVIAALLANDESFEASVEDINMNVRDSGKEKSASRGSSKGDIVYRVNMGRRAGLTPKDLVGVLKSQANLSDKAINDVRIKNTYSFFSVEKQHSKTIQKNSESLSFKGRKMSIQTSS